MKKLLLLFILTCMAFNTNAQSELINLNIEWLNQDDVDLSKINTSGLSGSKLIQKHLLLVEQTLRERKTDHLNLNQKANREKCLDILHDYAMAGIFPTNNKYIMQTPIFIDDYNVFCAVGHLMKETGQEKLAREIDEDNEVIYVRNIMNPDAGAWMNEYGLTLDECAWIQPQYGYESIVTDKRLALDLTGLTMTTPITARAVPGKNITFDASLEFHYTATDSFFMDWIYMDSTFVVDSNLIRLNYSDSSYSTLHLSFNQSNVYLLIEETPVFGEIWPPIFPGDPETGVMLEDSLWVENGSILKSDTAFALDLGPNNYGILSRVHTSSSNGTALVLSDSNATTPLLLPLTDLPSDIIFEPSSYIFEPIVQTDSTCSYDISLTYINDRFYVTNYGFKQFNINILDTTEQNLGIGQNLDDKFANSRIRVISSGTSTDHLTINYDDVLADNTIEIYNIEGKSMNLSVDRTRNSADIEISSLAPGIYFIRMGHDLARFYKK